MLHCIFEDAKAAPWLCGSSQCSILAYSVYCCTCLSEVCFVIEPNVMNNCWIVFQILTQWTTKGDSAISVNICQGLLLLNFCW
jgi:hypothetical protein